MGNYIVRLETGLAKQTLAIDGAWSALNRLKSYLESDKFHEDTTVQVKDVLLRIQQDIEPYFYATTTALTDSVVSKLKRA